MYLCLHWSAKHMFGEWKHLPWLFARGTVGFGGLGFGMYASQLLPLADAQTLVFTAPVFTLLVMCSHFGGLLFYMATHGTLHYPTNLNLTTISRPFSGHLAAI